MRKVCVNKSKFEKSIGYGSWAIITITILAFQTISIIEMNNVYSEREPTCYGIVDDVDCTPYLTGRSCYDSILYDEPKCSRYYSMEGITQERVGFFLMLNIINFVVMGIFIYYKQQKFKFEWCEKDE